MKSSKTKKRSTHKPPKPWAIAALVGGPFHGSLIPMLDITGLGRHLVVPLRVPGGIEGVVYKWLSWTDAEGYAGKCATNPPVYVAVYHKCKMPKICDKAISDLEFNRMNQISQSTGPTDK